MSLTDIQARNAKPGKKVVRLKDDRGLYLEISPAGGKWWRLRYWIAGKENRLSLGVYPEVSLKEARERRDEARRLIAKGIDPSEARKAEKAEEKAEAVTVEQVAREWHAKNKARWTALTVEANIGRLEKNVFPWIGARPIHEVLAPELLSVIRRIEARGAIAVAHRVLQLCGQVFRYAVASGRADRNPAADLKGALSASKVKHHAALTDIKSVVGLLRAMDDYQGSFVTRSAMRLAALTFVRPGELRHAEWSEIDMEKAEWRIPAEKMKMRSPHIVPLSRQAIEVLKELQPLTGQGRYLFPSERSAARAMSENTILAALRRMGYSKEEMTGHGFRSVASTLLNERGFNRDWIERQLAHTERNSVRAAYNYAEFLAERCRMMQAWADYLDGLKSGARILPLHGARTA